MPNGRKFMVTTENNSAKNSYIQSVELNGKPYLNSYIAYDDIVRGGTLKFVMGPQPSYDFGSAPEHRPTTKHANKDAMNTNTKRLLCTSPARRPC